MALVKKVLKEALEARILAIEEKLKISLDDKNKGIYNVQKLISEFILANQQSKNFNAAKFQDKMWTEISKIWSEALAKQIINTLSKELADIISDLMTEYIKSATIITPAGQLITGLTAAGAPVTGATSSPSPEATIN